MTSFKIGNFVKINPTSNKPLQISGEKLAKDYGLELRKVYTIIGIIHCTYRCSSRPWCPGRMKLGGIKQSYQCWGYGSDTSKDKWFGLIIVDKFGNPTLDQILGLEMRT